MCSYIRVSTRGPERNSLHARHCGLRRNKGRARKTIQSYQCRQKRRTAAGSNKAKANHNNLRPAALVRVCRERGMSLAEIADHLNKNGFFHSATSKKFYKGTFLRMLVNYSTT